jgi:hypothetical protein
MISFPTRLLRHAGHGRPVPIRPLQSCDRGLNIAGPGRLIICAHTRAARARIAPTVITAPPFDDGQAARGPATRRLSCRPQKAAGAVGQSQRRLDAGERPALGGQSRSGLAVGRRGRVPPRLLLELAERREGDHPADSLPVYRRHTRDDGAAEEPTSRTRRRWCGSDGYALS